MAKFHQQLVGLRRALLVVGWALVIARVALAFETNVRAKIEVPVVLADRVVRLDDDFVAQYVDTAPRDERGRTGYMDAQLIVRFQDAVEPARCRQVIAAQRTRSLRVLDPYRNIYLIELLPPLEVQAAIDQFGVLAEVDYVVPNAIVYAEK